MVHSDFLKLNLKDILVDNISPENKIKIIGNIPYNITSEILFRLYQNKDIIRSAVLMVQKEVAQRLVSQPNSKDYGILSVLTQIHTNPKILFKVAPASFFPKPRVDSSVIKFEFGKNQYNIKNEKLLTEIVKNSFGKRRKVMRNSLKKFFENHTIDPEKIDFDFSRRPESVSVGEFTDLSNQVYQLQSATK